MYPMTYHSRREISIGATRRAWCLWLFPLLLMSLLTLGTGARLQAAPLNPNSFPTLGANPFTLSGTYTADTSSDLAAPVLKDPNGTVVATGVFTSNNGNTEAVFCFTSIRIPAGTALLGVQDADSHPLTLLSKGSVTIDGTVNVSGASSSVFGANGSAAGPGGGGGGGGGGSGFGEPQEPQGTGGAGLVAGGNGAAGDEFGGGSGGSGGGVESGGGGVGDVNGSGGAFGGDGGSARYNPSHGTAYGDLTTKLEGGSGGGGQDGGSGGTHGSGGGGGGGAVEIDAASLLSVTGAVSANGGTSGYYAGGGAGGGILLSSATTVAIADTASVTAIGGRNFDGAGGGGGGGRVYLDAPHILATLADSVSVAGGGTSGDGTAGSIGVITTSTTPNTPPAVPTTNAQSVTTNENTAKAITLSGSDSDTPALPLTYQIATGPTHGTLSGLNASTGAVTYTPKAGYAGRDGFTFTVNNGYFDSLPATVAITVATGTPTATAQSVSVAFNTAKAIALTGSDPDVPALPLTYSVTSGPTHGTLTGAGASRTYTPTAGYHGADSFTFTASNGVNTSTAATVALNVATGVPTANAQSVITDQDTPVAVILTGSDPDVPALTLTYAVTASPAHGTLTGTAPSLTYTPAAGYSGADSFSFTVGNGTYTSAPATVSITVTQAVAQDVTAQVTVARGGYFFNRSRNLLQQVLTLTNTGPALAGPVTLAFDGLPQGVAVFRPDGTTQAALPAGSPYLVAVASGGTLAAGASVSVPVSFYDPAHVPAPYTPRVLAGPGAR